MLVSGKGQGHVMFCVKLWDLSNGTLVRDLRGHTDSVHALSFNRENTMLVSSKGQGHVMFCVMYTSVLTAEQESDYC